MASTPLGMLTPFNKIDYTDSIPPSGPVYRGMRRTSGVWRLAA